MDLPAEHISFSSSLMKFFGEKSLKESLLLKIIIGALLLVLVVLMYPTSESIEHSYTVGSVWADKDLVAPFSFSIYKDSRQYEMEIEEASHSVYPVFDRRESVEQVQVESLRAIMGLLRTTADARSRWLRNRVKSDSLLVEKNIAQLHFSLSEKELNRLARWQVAEKKNANQMFQKLDQSLTNLLAEIFRLGLIDRGKIRQAPVLFALRKGTTEEIVSSQKIFDVYEAHAVIQTRLNTVFGESDTSDIAEKILFTLLRPNLIFNQLETNRAIQIAQDNVPRTVGFVQENEHIINIRERITEEVKLKLDSYYKAKADRGAEHSIWSQRLGIFFHAGLILGLYSIYLYLFRKNIFHNNTMLTLIALLLLMETAFGYLSVALDVAQPIQYLVFVPAASMLLTIIFDSRVAFYGTVTMAFLIAGIRGNDYPIALVSLVAGTLGAYTVRDIHNRTQIFRSIVFIYLGYAVAIVALALQRFESMNTVIVEQMFALANAVFSPVITYGLLMFFEHTFKVTTDLTLHELSDFNHPLLRQLSEKAPGTFHHSMTLGSLAEAAAEAIGANPILARVGAYYHDIGKMHKPEYFVENQIGSVNRHNRLKPRMSALIITSHVKEGVELGREYGLPEKVLDFIPQHHGTTRISFFFDKALKQAAAKKNPKDVINEDDFRYPGPKPQSKETGIVMLADSVEASTRAIAEMTPQGLESAIENMIKQRFIDGQLDDCELTLRDLTKIKESFLQILIGIHHQRITYPEQEQRQVLAEQKPIEEPSPIEQSKEEPASILSPIPETAVTPSEPVPQPQITDRQQ